MQEFDSIRPYSDEETAPTIQRLLNDSEFLNMIGRFRSPRLAAWAPAPLRFFIRRWLLSHFGGINTIDDLQMSLSGYVDDLVGNTISKVTHSGLENLSKTDAHLFISNHRDIVCDPMIVNHLLFHNGFQTTRIAIGDNLLSNRVFAEMMKLNKSFLVRRNITSPREMRDAYLTLSGFINHSIDTNHSVWIAQREGRAKNGIDATDPAIIKMFYMNKKKVGVGFWGALSRLHIVPVSISYEYDPCDVDKARELEIRERTGEYQKADGEDSAQIMKGLTGPKGHVHVHFGGPISQAPDTPKELAAHIDHEMHANYHLHASNLAAYEMRNLQVETPETTNSLGIDAIAAGTYSNKEREEAKAEISKRLDECDEAGRKYLLDMYANPVMNALAARRLADGNES